MVVISRGTLVQYWKRHPGTEQELKAWFYEAKNSSWKTPADVKAKYGNASILKDGRVVFNICGNKHRLVVWVNYSSRTIYVRFVGSHKEYDKIDVQTI